MIKAFSYGFLVLLIVPFQILVSQLINHPGAMLEYGGHHVYPIPTISGAICFGVSISFLIYLKGK